ncbi:hypothetical protein [Emticicia sp. BO119]|uniref:hypothetical protein n=1 Tax=Emticicia sp. BO119 TaxID=2757768 RepID=UPI0015F103B9|nr:hypothetical protein [Emticicia sp. BO119]MBA4849030.1 hypothetical protein [Emticicia sp. BO119]
MQTIIDHIFSYENISYSILGLIGVLLHYLKLWKNAKDEGKRFSLRHHYPNLLLSIICTLILVFLKEDIKDIYVVTKFGAIALGFGGNALFFDLIGTRTQKSKIA